MSLPAPVSDRTALVTGSSSGIGVETPASSRHGGTGARGHGLTLVARREDTLHDLAASIGTHVEVIAADLSDPAARKHVLSRSRRVA